MSVDFIPPRADPFLNREDIRQRMTAHLHERRATGKPPRIHLHGMTGLGVSSLAQQFFAENKQHFADKLAWLSARRQDGTAVSAGELLSGVLSVLGVPEADQPTSTAECARTVQRLAGDTDILIIVDDLEHLRQIADLLNIDAPGMGLLVTAPSLNRELLTKGFARFQLFPLPESEAAALFRHVLADTAAEVNPATMRGLVEYCGGIPVLIKPLAAQIVGRARIAERMHVQLREKGVDVATISNDDRFATAMEAVYLGLESDIARGYRLLALLPGEGFTAEMAAIALDMDPDAAFEVLEKLVDFERLAFTARTQRYGYLRAVRDDARRRAEAEDEPELRAQVIARALRWFTGEILSHGRALSQRWWVDSVTALLSDMDLPQRSRAEALAWFSTQWRSLVETVRLAKRNGYHEWALALCVGSWKYLQIHGQYDCWIECHQIAIESAREMADAQAIMQLGSQLGAGYLGKGEYEEAGSCFTESLSIARELGHAIAEQSALEWLGKVAVAETRLNSALDYYAQSLAVLENSGERISAQQRVRAAATISLQRARALVLIGDWIAAQEAATAARDYFDAQPGETDNRAKSRIPLGEALVGAGEAEAAIEVFASARDMFAEEEVRGLVADTQVLLGKALATTGRSPAAQWESALAYYVEIGSARAEEVRSLLA